MFFIGIVVSAIPMFVIVGTGELEKEKEKVAAK